MSKTVYLSFFVKKNELVGGGLLIDIMVSDGYRRLDGKNIVLKETRLHYAFNFTCLEREGINI